MARKTPDLNLQAEERTVLSRDFNLFYKPEPEPEIQGVKELTASLNNFVNDAGAKTVIAKEYEEKEENFAQAKKDYELNKGKFRKAVKEGKIDVTGNPYYLEAYKELTLNSYANEFADILNKAYEEGNVIDDTREGAFDTFYKKQIEKFVKANNLSYFSAVELENGFFKMTTSNRSIMENNHRQSQMKLIKDKFDEKVKNTTYGIIAKYKAMSSDGSSIEEIITGLSNELNIQIGKIESVNGDGGRTIDLIFEGLESYVSSTTDFEFAKQIISQLPSKLLAGNNTVENIGRIQVKTNDLMALVLANEDAKLTLDNSLVEERTKAESVATFDFLYKQDDDFDVLAWLNDPKRTPTEVSAGEKWINEQQFAGGTADNQLAVAKVYSLLSEGKFEEAGKLAEEFFFGKQIRKETLAYFRTTIIPNYQNHKDKPIFNNPEYKSTMSVIEQVIATKQQGGDKQQGVDARNWLESTMLNWYRQNHKLDKYKDNSSAFNQAFIQEFRNNLEIIKSTKKADGSLLFTVFNFKQGESTTTNFNLLNEAKEKLENN